jgi:protein SCO1/2
MKTAFILVSAMMAGVGLWTGMQVFNSPVRNTAPLEIGGFLLEPTRPFPAFELIDDQQQAFTRENFQGAWSFIYFGFTFCPDICPTTLVEMNRLKDRLTESHPDINTAFYLVSVDPARDTPERLNEYVKYFDEDFRGLTGELGEIDKLARTASVIYVIPEVEPGEPYQVGHSSTITLLDPTGEIRAVFREPLRANSLYQDVSNIWSRY